MTTDLSLYTHKIFEGEAFTVARGVNIGSGATASVYIENPAGSGKTIVIHSQSVRTDSAAIGTYYRSPDASGGTMSTATSDFVGSGESSVANVRFDASYSNATSSTDFPISETGGDKSGLVEREPVALQPDESIAIELNSDASDNDVLFMFTFYESERGIN